MTLAGVLGRGVVCLCVGIAALGAGATAADAGQQAVEVVTGSSVDCAGVTAGTVSVVPAPGLFTLSKTYVYVTTDPTTCK